MKTKIKSTALILVATIILMAISSIVTTGAIKKQEKIVAFQKSGSEKVSGIISLDKFQNYNSEYAKYRTDYYYNTLSENDKLLYHIYEYALENSYEQIYLDERYITDLNYLDILKCFSLDSAILETNLSTDTDGVPATLTIKHLKFFDIEYATQTILVNNFNEENLNKQLEAVKEAEKIVAQLPDGLSELEIAEYYLSFLSKKVTYEEGSETKSYLYDSLIAHKGNCDAFSSAYSLLCKLSGIECFEKVYIPENKEEVGHVWNCIKIGDKYYNVDASNQSEFKKYGFALWFGYSDSLQKGVPEFASILPKCSDDKNLIIKMKFKSIEDENFSDEVKSGFEQLEKNSEKVLLVSLEDNTNAIEEIKQTGLTVINSFTIINTEDDEKPYDYYMIIK